MEVDDLCDVEETQSNAAFVHGRSFGGGKADILMAMHTLLRNESSGNFKGVRLDTFANRRSIISTAQYAAYCHEFSLKRAIKESNGETVGGIGGSQSAVGMAMIQIPFRDLELIIDVWFTVINQDVPTLLSMRDMVTNGLGISIQKCHVHFRGRVHQLGMRNFFLIHTWAPTDMPFVMYTKRELRTVHRTFGHPSIGAT